MHVIAINGSPRETTTQRLLEAIADRLASHDIQVSIVPLKDKRIEDCRGCEACIRRTSECVVADDARDVLAQLQAADGIILASPVYLMQVTGKLKSLIDKTASWVHRPVLVGVPVLVAATTGGSGLKQTLSYLEDVAIQWGAQPSGRIGRVPTDPQEVSEREIARFVTHLRQPRTMRRPGMRQLIFFQVQKVLALKLSALDHTYWAERHWLERDFYYTCRIPLHKRLVARLFFHILYGRVKPVATI